MARFKPEPGCYGEGTFGHQYTRAQCAATVELRSGPLALLRALNADMSDDANEETEACAWLNEHAPLEGHWWGWQDGDFGLWPDTSDRETDPNLCDRWEQP